MNASDLVREYGYYAVIIGTFFEGELIMLAAGVAASAGVLNLPAVILAGMAGIFASDTFCFFLGRIAGERIKRWLPRLSTRLAGVFRVIERHEEKLIVYFQFFPGLCTVTPMAFGMTAISTPRFMMLDLIGNVFWTLVFSLGGYVFGSAFEHVVLNAERWRPLAYLAIGLVVTSLWWAGRRLGKKIERSAN